MVEPGQKPQEKLTPPMKAKERADLAVVRMMERDRLEREHIMAAATTEVAFTRAGTTRSDRAAGERTTRQGATVDTPPPHHAASDRPVTGAVVPPGVTTTTPLKPYVAVDERVRMHAEDQSVHLDWETHPQINAPRDVGAPNSEREGTTRLSGGGETQSGHDMDVERGSVIAVREDVHTARKVTKGTVREPGEGIEREI